MTCTVCVQSLQIQNENYCCIESYMHQQHAVHAMHFCLTNQADLYGIINLQLLAQS